MLINGEFSITATPFPLTNFEWEIKIWQVQNFHIKIFLLQQSPAPASGLWVRTHRTSSIAPTRPSTVSSSRTFLTRMASHWFATCPPISCQDQSMCPRWEVNDWIWGAPLHHFVFQFCFIKWWILQLLCYLIPRCKDALLGKYASWAVKKVLFHVHLSTLWYLCLFNKYPFEQTQFKHVCLFFSHWKIMFVVHSLGWSSRAPRRTWDARGSHWSSSERISWVRPSRSVRLQWTTRSRSETTPYTTRHPHTSKPPIYVTETDVDSAGVWTQVF